MCALWHFQLGVRAPNGARQFLVAGAGRRRGRRRFPVWHSRSAVAELFGNSRSQQLAAGQPSDVLALCWILASADRDRSLNLLGKGSALTVCWSPPSRARGNDQHMANAAPFPSRFKGAIAPGQCQNPTECEHIRRLPCSQLLPAAVAEELRHRRSPSPKRKTAAGLAVGQHDQDWPRAVRRPHAHGSRARSPSLKCRSAHTPQTPSASGFDRVVKRPTR